MGTGHATVGIRRPWLNRPLTSSPCGSGFVIRLLLHSTLWFRIPVGTGQAMVALSKVTQHAVPEVEDWNSKGLVGPPPTQVLCSQEWWTGGMVDRTPPQGLPRVGAAVPEQHIAGIAFSSAPPLVVFLRCREDVLRDNCSHWCRYNGPAATGVGVSSPGETSPVGPLQQGHRVPRGFSQNDCPCPPESAVNPLPAEDFPSAEAPRGSSGNITRGRDHFR